MNYTVIPNDTFYNIAQANGLTQAQLEALNPAVSPNAIYPGQVLVISTSTPPSGKNYTVIPNDTFYNIAQTHGLTQAQLEALNPDVSPNAIYPGQVLVISTSTPPSGKNYTVIPNDTFYNIAQAHGLTQAQLEALNPDVSPNTISPGMVLVVYGPAETDTTRPPQDPKYVAPPQDIKYTGHSTIDLRVGYVQLSGQHSAEMIAGEGIQSCNVIVFAFAVLGVDTPPTAPSNYSHQIQYVMDNACTGTVFLYSVGGANCGPNEINEATAPDIVSDVMGQIKKINSSVLGDKRITGVDLDLENCVTSATITALGTRFRQQQINGNAALVSLAPQIVSTDDKDISSSNPANLALSSGYPNGSPTIDDAQYNAAINAIGPDFIFVQCYNTDNISIDGLHEYDDQFFTKVVAALTNLASTDVGVNPLSIKAGVTNGRTKIAVGFPSNRGAGNKYTIFNPGGGDMPLGKKYEQMSILSSISSQAGSLNPTVAGIMVWSLNNDYYPKLYQDGFAGTGYFCQEIFGAAKVAQQPDVPYLTLYLQYCDSFSQGGGIAVTLKIGDNYYCFGCPGDGGTSTPLPPGKAVTWSTLTPLLNADSTPLFCESGNLDELAVKYAPESKIPCTLIISYYSKSTDPISKYDVQSQPIDDFSLEMGCDNLISVTLSNTTKFLGYGSKEQPHDGAFNYSWTIKGESKIRDSRGKAFWWSHNVPSRIYPSWMTDIFEELIGATFDALLGEATGGVGPLLMAYLQDEKRSP